MNNRQKAKHWKQLYESMLAKTAPPMKIVHQELRHYRAETLVEKKDCCGIEIPPEIVMYNASRRLLKQMRDVVQANMIAEKETITQKIKYSVDVWFEK